jgi:chemotaxis protein methyltransferase CheR
LEQVVLPEIVKRRGDQKCLSVWSAGCSTGEEPYSIAISILKSQPQVAPWDLRIHASDISLRTLMVAKQGFYDNSRVTHVPPDLLAKHFINLQDGYEVNPDLKKRVRFDYHNLQNVSPLRDLDVIFCRNVIIYFDEATQEKVIDFFYDALGPKGYLFLGHSESLFSMKTRFQLYKTDKTTLYYKDVTQRS